MRELLRRIGFLFHRAQYERDLEEEMADHLARIEQEKGANARRQFGNIALLKEESRGMWTFRYFEEAAQDVRYALRMMAANPLFTATAVVSLALGIGANTAIYSFLDAVLLRSLPVQQTDQLAILQWHALKHPGVAQSLNGSARRYGAHGTVSPNFPYAAYETLRADRSVFSSLIAYTYVQDFNAIVNREAEAAPGGFVSGNYFSGLGVPPAVGRLITEDDDRKGATPVVVLTYPYWQRRFGGAADVAGKQILLNGLPFTIAGVSAPNFFGVDPQENPMFFLPIHTIPMLSQDPAKEERSRFYDDHFYWVEMMGRLQPGRSLAQAQAAVRAQFAAFATSTARSAKEAEVLPELALEPGGAGIDSLRRQHSKPLYVLMTMVGLILAIACANLANLLLARAAARRREMAVRLSLGAGRWRVARQMLTESVLLSVAGGVLGIAVAIAGIRFITALMANGREDFSLRAAIDWPVLGFTFAIAVAAGVVFGLAPALQATKVDFTPALKESRTRGGSAGRHRVRLGYVLIVAQIAISMLLVLTAGLFVRTLFELHSIDVGFNRDNILLVTVNGRQAGYRGAALARFYSGLIEKFRQIPEVKSASGSTFPLVSQYVNNERVTIPGRAKQDDQATNVVTVEPGFLETMQIPVLSGRGLERGDLATPTVAVINPKFATTFFPGENSLGRQFLFAETNLVQIVGVARAAHYNSLREEEQPLIYIPYTWNLPDLGGLFFELRTAGPPMAALPAVRRQIREANREVSIAEVTTQAQRMDQTIAQERTFANLGASFAVLALLIACVGLYGAMAYTVARRTGEIGIRMALGAQRPRILWMVLRQVLVLTGIGLLLGYAASRFTTKLVGSFLYGLKPNDPLTTVAALAILGSAAFAAGYLPAWRASKIDPAVAPRNE